METCKLSEGIPKVLLLIPNQDFVLEASSLLTEQGILHLVYPHNGRRDIAVSLEDVDKAQTLIAFLRLGNKRDVNETPDPEAIVYKVKSVYGGASVDSFAYGTTSMGKYAARQLARYGLPSWIMTDSHVAVRKWDKAEVEECLNELYLTYELVIAPVER